MLMILLTPGNELDSFLAEIHIITLNTESNNFDNLQIFWVIQNRLAEWGDQWHSISMIVKFLCHILPGTARTLETR